jgi:hypothetical protein
MNVQPVGVQSASSLSQASELAATLPRLSQSSFLADDPFAAYLLSLSDAASLAMAAITGRNATPAAASPAAGAAPSPGEALTASARQGHPVSAALRAAAALVASPAATSTEDSVLSAVYAANLPATVGAPLAGASDAAGAAVATTPDDANTLPAVQVSADAATATALAAESAPAATADQTVSVPGAGEPLDPAGTATDATAKFMGGGILSASASFGSGPAKPEEVIPAVNQVLASTPMAANTYGRPLGRGFAQPLATRPVAPAPVPAIADTSTVDLLV